MRGHFNAALILRAARARDFNALLTKKISGGRFVLTVSAYRRL
jgi:hypothetical protein